MVVSVEEGAVGALLASETNKREFEFIEPNVGAARIAIFEEVGDRVGWLTIERVARRHVLF